MRAIILAAGMGTRLRPLTLTTPKSLIVLNGETLIERQIGFLREIGVEEIVVVTGYLSDKFSFLADKYGVTLVHNPHYNRYNNLYTMYLVKDYLRDAYVIDADNYLCENFLHSQLNHSTYFAAYKEGFTDEWLLICDSNNKVEEICVTSGEGTILSGVSYWTEADGLILRDLLLSTVERGEFTELYWDDLVKENLNRLSVYKEDIASQAIFEIDNLEDLEKVQAFVESEKQ